MFVIFRLSASTLSVFDLKAMVPDVMLTDVASAANFVLISLLPTLPASPVSVYDFDVFIAVVCALFAFVVASEAAVDIAVFLALLAFVVASLAAVEIAVLCAALALFVASAAAVAIASLSALSIAVPMFVVCLRYI